ncbi:MAG: cation:proton antiporter, partial [Chloroflexota bacterium]
MEQLGLVVDLSLALGGALIAGLIAHRLGQPAVLGYLAAGIAVGPYSPIGLDPSRVEEMAGLGILLLMFTLGIQFSLNDLRRVRNVAVYGGALQMIVTMAFGTGLGLAFGFTTLAALFFGALIALSSTVVVMKVLMERGELDAAHGRVMLGMCLVQDLSLVPLMVVLPALAGPLESLPAQVGLAAGKAALVLLLVFLPGTRLLRRLLYRVAATRSRELFLITVVFMAAGMAAIVSLAGLSLALGAFLAGLVISESQYSHQTLGDVIPLRDLFSVLFFVSIGMLVNPAFIAGHALMLLLAVAAIVLGKFVVVAALVRAFAYPARTAVYAGLGMIQIGEFSFVLAELGVNQGILPEEVFSLTITAALVTIVLTPLALQAAEPILGVLRPLLGRQGPEGTRATAATAASPLSGHAVILGYGEVGQMISRVLAARGFPQLIIDHDPRLVSLARTRGLACLYGDAANEHVLAQTNLPRARVLAVALPDPIAAQLAIAAAKRLNPRVDIVVRAPGPGALRLLRDSGAREVINPALEVSLEMARHALQRFGVSNIESLAVINRLRLDRSLESL